MTDASADPTTGEFAGLVRAVTGGAAGIGQAIARCVSPGTVHTGFVDRMLAGFSDPAAEKAALDARQATGRMVTPHEVADAVAHLASPRSRSTTGIALPVDGGFGHVRIRPGTRGTTR